MKPPPSSSLAVADNLRVAPVQKGELLPPDDFTEESTLAIWNWAVNDLKARGLASPSFMIPLIAFCRSWETYQEVTEALRGCSDVETRYTDLTPKGTKISILYEIQQRSLKQINQFCTQFGWNPSAAINMVSMIQSTSNDEKSKKRNLPNKSRFFPIQP